MFSKDQAFGKVLAFMVWGFGAFINEINIIKATNVCRLDWNV